MPKLDGTGPKGEGPKTGRGFGNCNDPKNIGVNNNILRGLGKGQGIIRKQTGRQNVNRGNR